MPWSVRMTMMAFAAVIIPFIYVFWRYSVSLGHFFPSFQKEIRHIFLAAFIFINLLPLTLGYKYLTGNLPELFLFRNNLGFSDYLLNFPFWLGLITIIEVLPYLILVDIIALTGKFLSVPLNQSLKNWLHILRLVLVPSIFIFVLVRSYLDTYTIRTSSYTIPMNIPAQQNKNLTIGLIADLQVDRYTQNRKINQLLEIIEKENTDLLFFAGDLVTRGTDFIDQGVTALCKIEAQIRVACIGDHDIWSDPNRIAADIEKCGWHVLHDEHRLFQYNGLRILISGVTYAYSQRISKPALDQLLRNAPEADIKILLVHQPAKMVLNAAQEFGYNIFLAGHTHGGQVIFKPFGVTLTPTQAENEIFAGYTALHKLNVFVSNGIGLTMMPLRFRASAEFVKINVIY